MENQTVTEEENAEEVVKTAEAEVETEEVNEEETAENVADILEAAPKAEVDYKEKYYYLAAEMDNMQKRYDREKSNYLKFGNENILKDLVDVQDNFERTVQAMSQVDNEQVKNAVVGIEMIGKQFLETLGKHGLNEVKPDVGEEFDPNKHEAMAQQESADHETNKIIQVYQNGYMLNGRLLRAAKVIIAK